MQVVRASASDLSKYKIIYDCRHHRAQGARLGANNDEVWQKDKFFVIVLWLFEHK